MLTEHQSGGRTVWVDLFNPTRQEIDKACTDYALNIPPREQLEEIEFSSRLQYEDGVFTLSVPVTPHNRSGNGPDQTSPLGFVLNTSILVTVRFDHLATFDAITERVKRRTRSAPDIFMVIVEALVDYNADRLEELRHEAQAISRRIFHKQMRRARHNAVNEVDRMLRDTLVEIGDMGERLSHTRDTLLVLQRAMPFVSDHGRNWLEDRIKTRLNTAEKDVQSLNDYEIHLADKFQFLLDAALGFVATEQNNLFKVLTIASVVGIPPVLMAGIWGMNFRFMPELAWHYGYPFAWAMIVVSALLPMAWFKWKGWW